MDDVLPFGAFPQRPLMSRAPSSFFWPFKGRNGAKVDSPCLAPRHLVDSHLAESHLVDSGERKGSRWDQLGWANSLKSKLAKLQSVKCLSVYCFSAKCLEPSSHYIPESHCAHVIATTQTLLSLLVGDLEYELQCL